MILQYLDLKKVDPHNPRIEDMEKVIVEDVIKINLSKGGFTFWLKDSRYYYIPLYRVGDVRIYENRKD